MGRKVKRDVHCVVRRLNTFVSLDLTKRLQRIRSGGQYNTSITNNSHNSVSAVRESRTENLSKQFAARVQLNWSHDAVKDLKHCASHGLDDRVKLTDKSDRATTEQVLDPRTRMILFKMINRGLIYQVNGCVSTGKEANVYHSVTQSGEERAIKVYKTSILTFKDRDRYVTGEFRFRSGYCKSNPRKMVKVWAEKELRNLKRLEAAGIPCPKAIGLRMHVLVMEFLGSNGWAAPRLKDAGLDAVRLAVLYRDLVKILRVLYQTCRLVHADLSEYNLLYHQEKLYVIDVSQSVEHDHPHALEFLRADCKNATDFFARQGVTTLSLRQLFDFITDISPTFPAGEQQDTLLSELLEKRAQHTETDADAIAEEVFQQIYIPRTLDEIVHVEQEVEKFSGGNSDEVGSAPTVALDVAGLSLFS